MYRDSSLMEFLTQEWIGLFCLALLCMSFLYASVGHGGASAYLALMSFFGFSHMWMKPTALILNIAVSGVSFWYFNKRAYFSWRLFYPLAITSVPAAFVGGFLEVDPLMYKRVLALFLLIAVARMSGLLGKEKSELKDASRIGSLILGLVIGFFSGMIGIGGGIILSPVLILLAWADMKQAAAVSALFILVNSVAGLLGFVLADGALSSSSLFFIPIVILGAVIGAYCGSSKFSTKSLRYLLAAVLVVAAIKLVLVS